MALAPKTDLRVRFFWFFALGRGQAFLLVMLASPLPGRQFHKVCMTSRAPSVYAARGFTHEGETMSIHSSITRSALAAAVTLCATIPAQAHHGFGLFQLDQHVEYYGVLTKMELVNPHSYMYFDVTDAEGNPVMEADGSPFKMRCEMRAATLIRRSGWNADMFVVGSTLHLQGNPHRDDPHACYVENFSLGDAPMINRNDQFSSGEVDLSKRPARLPTGEPNITGDWAVEQLVLTVPPSGGNGSMVPRSFRERFAAGEISIEEIRATQPPPVRPVYTEAGQAAAASFNNNSAEDNPRYSCKPISIIADWTWDWPVNRIVQSVTPEGDKVIDIDSGLYGWNRRIHMDQYSHPDNIVPGYAGHSIGHWEGDTLVVDTIGFTPGLLQAPTRTSDQLHIVERFTLDMDTMQLKREYTATDPVNLAQPYSSYEVSLLSAVPFTREECRELTPEFDDEA